VEQWIVQKVAEAQDLEAYLLEVDQQKEVAEVQEPKEYQNLFESLPFEEIKAEAED
jgi:hypothetical protein